MLRRCTAIFILISSTLQAQTENLRSMYLSATDATSTEKLLQAAQQADQSNPLFLAYHGTALAMMAGHVSGPREKLKWFDQGKELIEKAAAADPNNPEIAFLRFSVQSEAPRFLGYHNQISSDANIVVAALRSGRITHSEKFWISAIRYMNQSGKLNKLQQAEISKYLS